jgi:uncharacterized membrane protein
MNMPIKIIGSTFLCAKYGLNLLCLILSMYSCFGCWCLKGNSGVESGIQLNKLANTAQTILHNLLVY